MNDSFGSLSQDFLPASYGSSPTKMVQPANAEAPTMEAVANPDDYDGVFSNYQKEEVAQANPPPTPSPPPDYGADADTEAERGAFWKGLGSSLKGMFGSPQATTSGSGHCVRRGKDDYTYHQYPDGKVHVASGPPGGRYIGQTWSADHPGSAQVKNWYGPCTVTSSGSTVQVDRAERGAAIGAGIGAAAAQLIPSLASILGPQEVTTFDEEYEDVAAAPAGPNMGLIIGGVAVVGLVGVGIWMATRDKDED